MYIKKIKGIIPFTEKQIEITLDNNDLIITGKNGCGKTQLLESIFNVLSMARSYKSAYIPYIDDQIKREIALEKDTEAIKENFEKSKPLHIQKIKEVKETIEQYRLNLEGHSDPKIKAHWSRNIDDLKRQLINIQKAIDVGVLEKQLKHNETQFNIQKELRGEDLNLFLQFKEEKNNKITKRIEILYNTENIDSENSLDLILFFEASRISSFQLVQNIGSLEKEKQHIKSQSRQGRDSNAGSLIERFLANWEVKSALREKKNDISVTTELNKWKKQFVESLRVLLDDETTKIEFNDNTLNYEIIQKGKERFSFRDLSSGYSAILKVFVEILMQTEVSEYSPHSISGYVIIDEIDVHLHASLQRKVLPFLSSLFPKVQFIVSTHSPFVLMSVNDAVIFDMEKNAQMNEDLSFYSYSAVLEGVLGIKPTSLIVENTILELSEIMNSQNINREKLEKLINTIEPLSDKLNNREKSFYLQGVNILADMDNE